MKKIIIYVLSTLLVISAFAGCVSEPQSESPAATEETSTSQEISATTEEGSAEGETVDTVYIGMCNPITGGNADSGQQDLDACKIAVKRINEEGGIKALGGAKVELVVIDSTSDATQSAQILERAISSNNLSGIVGPGTGDIVFSILPVIEKYKIPALVNAIPDKITESGYTYVFQAVPKASMFGQQQISYIQYLNEEKGCGIKKIAIAFENSSYGQSTAEGAKKYAEQAGFEVVLYESFTQNSSDLSSLVTAMKNTGAGCILPVAHSQDAKLMVNTMKALNYNPIIIGGGAGFLWPLLGKELGRNLMGLYLYRIGIGIRKMCHLILN